MLNLFRKQVVDSDSQTKDLLKKLGDALTVMTKIDDEQQRQIAALKRELSNERESRSRTELHEIRRLKQDNLKLQQENRKLKVKLDILVNTNLPKEFEQKISGDYLSIRVRNVLRNESWDTYLDILDVSEVRLLRTPNMGRKSIRALKEHLQSKFPDKHHKFAVFGSVQ